MFYLNKKQLAIKQLVDDFSCITISQINNILDLKSDKKTMNLLDELVKKPEFSIKREGSLLLKSYINLKNIDVDMLKAVDALSVAYKMFTINWYMLSKFPFKITFSKDTKLFDIAVINEGMEKILVPAINLTNSEQIILVISNKTQIDKINISNKKYKFFITKVGV
ncbi:DUF5697 family protein [Clostridium tyrobutyricum]|nr:DUF5697 family protein [Clostridium tyrobutyricum]